MTDPMDYMRNITSAFPAHMPEPADMTEQEKLAVAIAAGCEIETEWTGDRVVVRTKRKIGIVKINGRYRVYEEAKPSPETDTPPAPAPRT